MTPDPDLVRELRAVAGDESVLLSAEACAPFECDALTAHRRRPDIVVLPRSAEQVMDVLRACRRHRTPVVARGAGTGLSGGALPVEGGVLLVLARLDRVLEVDPGRRLARVELPAPRDDGCPPGSDDRCCSPRSPREAAPHAHLNP